MSSTGGAIRSASIFIAVFAATCLAAATSSAVETSARRACMADFETGAVATGWPADGRAMSPRDIGMLGRRIVGAFPGYCPCFAGKWFRLGATGQRNRAPPAVPG